jgi:hypothetical protein
MRASHVVVDTRDGYIFWRGADGKLFTQETACAYARMAHTYDKKGSRNSYRVFELHPSRCANPTGE